MAHAKQYIYYLVFSPVCCCVYFLFPKYPSFFQGKYYQTAWICFVIVLDARAYQPKKPLRISFLVIA